MEKDGFGSRHLKLSELVPPVTATTVRDDEVESRGLVDLTLETEWTVPNHHGFGQAMSTRLAVARSLTEVFRVWNAEEPEDAALQVS